MKKALEDVKYELIKAHVVDPSNSPLTQDDQDLCNRIMSIAKVLDKQPIQKNAVALHMAKYKHISRSQAYEDCRLAMRLFNTIYTFDYDFWQTWLINDIIRLIDRCRKSDDPKAWRVWAAAQSNLRNALGEKPQKELDPKLVQEHTFLIPIQINNTTYNFDLEKFLGLPDGMRKKVTDALVSEITDVDAEEIMKT
jgi:hypothetical protein